MDTILFWGIIAILCAACESIGIWKRGLAAGFIITTILLAIHYDFGNDYWSYYEWYEASLYTPLPNSISAFLEISRAPGWDLLNFAFGNLFGENGFYMMVAFLSIIESVCYCLFIKKHVPNNWYWLAMAIYVLNNHFFILTFSMMRQSLVMALLLICYTWIEQRKIILPLLVILFASTIHNSVLLCCPLIFIPYISNKQRVLSLILFVAWLLLLIASSILEPILSQVANFTEVFAQYVDTYTKDSEMTFGVGYLLRLLPFFYMLYGLFTNQFAKNDVSILIIWSLSIILTPFGMIVPLFARFIFYFELASLVALPRILNITSSIAIRSVIILSTLLLSIIALYEGFYLPTGVYYDYYQKFDTISKII